MRGLIYQKKRLRESFMQEILNAADSATYRLALEKHIVEYISLEDEHSLALQARQNEATVGQLKAGSIMANMQGLTKA